MSMSIGSTLAVSGYQSVPCTGNPNQDAKNFANANNISEAEAKQILSGAFGDPAQSQNSSLKYGGNSQDSEYGFAMSIDVPGYTPVQATGDPNKDAQNFADANELSLDEAKAIISGKLGAPSQPTSQTTQTSQTTNNSTDDCEEETETNDYSSWYSDLSTRQQTAVDKLENAIEKYNDARAKIDEAKDNKNAYAVQYAHEVANYWYVVYLNCYNNARTAGLSKDDLSNYVTCSLQSK